MNKLFRVLMSALLLCLLYTVGYSTTITIQSTQVPNWTRTGSVAPKLRVYYDKTFTSSAGTIVASGSPTSGVAYKVVTCTILGGTVTIPTFTIDSTRDGIDARNARVSFYWFNGNTNLGAFDPYVNLQIPESLSSTSGCSPAGTCATFSDLRVYNAGAPPLPAESYYSTRQVDMRILASAGAPTTAPYLTTTADSSLTGETNLGLLTTGLLKISVSGAVATPSTAVAGTDYQTPLVAGTDYLAPNGSGASLTNLNASNLASGTVPDARFPSTLPALSGANLTALNASNLASGTVPDARFPATLPAVSGANLTNLNATNLSSGTLPDARFPSTLPAVSGANLTNLNATNLASGTVPDGRLSVNVSLLGSAIDLSGAEATGILAAARFPALTGDVTTSSGAVATTIANDAVSFAKMQNIATARLLGRGTASSGDVEEITVSAGSTGTDFNIAYSAGALALNIPDAGASARGLVTTGTQTFAGAKTVTSLFTTLSTGKSIAALENALSSSMLSTSNENDYGAIGFQRGASGISAATGTPFLNFQIHQRPNASVGQTVLNYAFFSSRHGSGGTATANGGAEAIYNLAGIIESDATVTSLNSMHDIVGIVGLAIGRSGSTARSYGAHFDARLETTSGAAIGAESVVRNTAGTAPTIQSGTEAGRTVGFNIVGRATGSGSKNTVGLLFQSGDGATSAFKTGIYFEANTVDASGYAMDFNALGIIPAMRFANGQPIVGRNAAGSADVVLFSINSSDQLSFASTGNASVFGGTITSSTHYGGSSAGSTLSLQGTSNGSPANAYVLINTVASGAYPGTVGIGAPSSKFISVGGQTDVLHLQAADGTIGLITFDSYANGGNVTSGIAFRSAGGTAATPSATAANASLASFGGRQHDGTNFATSNQAAIQFRAAEAAGASALGTYITLETTPNGSTSRAERWRVDHGGWLIGKEQSTNPTTSELAAGDQAALYVKGDKFVIAYNQGGTIKYIVFTLDGSTTTFTNSTSAP
jgi:hypothetical protein